MTIFADSMPLVRFVVFVRSFSDQASPTKHQQFLRCLDILHVSTTVLACSDDPDWDLPWFIECVFTPRDVFALVRSLWCNWEKLYALIFSGTSASIKNVNTKSLSNFKENRTARTSILFFLDPPPLGKLLYTLLFFHWARNVVEFIDNHTQTHTYRSWEESAAVVVVGIYPTSVFIY